ncbi:hypothetical protein [Clostridium sp. Marseille-QA1073]
MYKIKYFIEEIVKIIENEDGITSYEKEVKAHEYQCKDSEFEYWLNCIKEAYGQHGNVTHEHVEDQPTKEELTIKTINNLTIENKKKDVLIASLAEQINSLNIKLIQLGGSGNV